MIYLDNSSTTKPYPEILQTYEQVSQRFLAIHHHCTSTEWKPINC